MNLEEVSSLDAVEAAFLKEELLRLTQEDAARRHPAFFLHFVSCVDSRSGERFEFELLSEEEARSIGVEPRGVPWDPSRNQIVDCAGLRLPEGNGWCWQRDYLNFVHENDQTISLKGRQLGVTWTAGGYGLWVALTSPGSDVLVYSIKEDDASEVINRIWDMWLSCPDHLRMEAEVIKPTRSRPSTRIEFRFPDGRVSSIQGMAATKSAGHSRSAAFILFDEGSRQEFARDLWKAVVPATADDGGKVAVVSTANGMSDPTTKLGNFFHELWVGAGYSDYPTLKPVFLHWSLHPKRGVDWKDKLNLDDDAKAEQYPETPEEAFLMSGSPFFDVSALRWYSENALLKPLFKARFDPDSSDPRKAKLVKEDGAPISVFRLPEKGHRYAIANDVSTGSGADYSVAAVIDLSDMAPVAELHGKLDADQLSMQLHFLGHWYNHARIAPEKGGGYGDTVIAYLRDGKGGRPPYQRLYRYRRVDRAGADLQAAYGFPMNMQTRPLVIAGLKRAIREKALPGMTPRLMAECRTFVHRDTNPSPRAADGANDDAVMAWAIALELYREFGEHPLDVRKDNRRRKHRPKKPYPWS